MSARHLVNIGLLLGLASSGCDIFGPRDCSIVGCAPSLPVIVEGTVDEAYELRLTTADGEVETTSCISTAPCELWLDVTPDELVIVFEPPEHTAPVL